MNANVKQRKRLWEEATGHCIYCGRPVSQEEMAVDHIVPLSKGGENNFNNKVCSCAACNAKKANQDPYDFVLDMPESQYCHFMNRVRTLEEQGKLSPEKVRRLLALPSVEPEWEEEPACMDLGSPFIYCNVYVSIRN
ncbi:MAG: HNH endonuclease [Bacteroidales bacterium]|nr:HNH endonuclease [Bacteroidales bacterium]